MRNDDAPFNGDTIAATEAANLIRKWGIQTAVETGTEGGATAQYLATLCYAVWTVELDRDNRYRNSNPHINALYDSSPTFLSKLLPMISKSYNIIFFFLDAHNAPTDTPLLEELRQIAALNPDNAVLMIHDFMVPGKSEEELGWDTYNGVPYTFSYVQKALEEVYPNGFEYHYNTEAEGAKRGILYVEPIRYD